MDSIDTSLKHSHLLEVPTTIWFEGWINAQFKGWAYQRIDKESEAHRYFLRKYASPYVDQGFLKGKILGDYDGAIADLSKAQEIESQDADAYKNRGAAKAAAGYLQGACADRRRVSSLGFDISPELKNMFLM